MSDNEDNAQKSAENTLSLTDEKDGHESSGTQKDKRSSKTNKTRSERDHTDEDVYNYEYDEYSEESQQRSQRRARDRKSRQAARKSATLNDQNSMANNSFTNQLNTSQVGRRKTVGNLESMLERQRDESFMRSRRGQLTRRGTQNVSDMFVEPPPENMPVRQATRTLAEALGGEDSKLKEKVAEMVKANPEPEEQKEQPAQQEQKQGSEFANALQESNLFVKPNLTRQLSSRSNEELEVNASPPPENKPEVSKPQPTKENEAKTEKKQEDPPKEQKTEGPKKEATQNVGQASANAKQDLKNMSINDTDISHTMVKPKASGGLGEGKDQISPRKERTEQQTSFQPPPTTSHRGQKQQSQTSMNPGVTQEAKSLNMTLSQSLIGETSGVQPEQVITLVGDAAGAEGPFYKASKASEDYTVDQQIAPRDLRRFIERFQRHFGIHVSDLAGFNFNTIVPADISAAQDMFLQSQHDYEILYNKHAIASKALDQVKQFFEYRGLQFDEQEPRQSFQNLREQLLSETVAAERYASGEDLLNTTDLEKFSKLHIIEEYRRVRRLFRVTVRQLQNDLEDAKNTIQKLRMENGQLKGLVDDEKKKVTGLKQRAKVMSQTLPYSKNNGVRDPYGFDELRKQSQVLLKRAEQLGYK